MESPDMPSSPLLRTVPSRFADVAMLPQKYVHCAGGVDKARWAVWLAVWLMMAGALAASPASSFKPLRYEENYSSLKHPANWTRELLAIEPLKYIPFGASEDSYVSVGGEARAQGKFYRHSNFGVSD